MKTWHLDPAEVIEGIAPILADFDDDGAMEILVTISDPQQGARYVLYDQQGGRIASSQPIGRGFRWRHQIAVGPFGESGELELAGLRTPHINGTVEFFRLEGTSLRLVAELEGYSSHELGSRNLDMALAGDFNGDGQLEVVVPREDFEGLAGIQRTAAGVEVVWTVELGGKLASNLMGLETEAGGLLLGAATQEGELLIWMP